MSCYLCTFEIEKVDINEPFCKMCNTIIIFKCPQCTFYNTITSEKKRICEQCEYHLETCRCLACELKDSFLNQFVDYAEENKVNFDMKVLKYMVPFICKSFFPTSRNYLRSFIRVVSILLGCVQRQK